MDKSSGSEIFSKEHRSRYATFVGVDLHKSTVTLAAGNAEQEIVSLLTVSTKCVDRIEAWLRALPQPVWMAVEAVGFIEWFLDRFGGCVARIDIADATELAHRRGKRPKNDKNDSRDIARRLAVGDCPLGWIAEPALMRLRKLGRHWRRLSRTISRAKHGMKSILNAANLAGPKLDGAGAHKWFLAQGRLLKDGDRLSFRDLLDVVLLMERQREHLRLEIILANREPRFLADIELLKTVPGIDEIWACIIAAEIGPFSRFPNADALEFWSGLTPNNETTAGRTQSGHITKAGSATLRWAACKAAVTLCKSDRRQETVRRRLIKRIGKARANCAFGRRLLRILFAMMRDRSPYRRQLPTNHLAQANLARLQRRGIPGKSAPRTDGLEAAPEVAAIA